MKDSKETLAQKLGIEMPEAPVEEATELKADVLDTENLKEVVLELSNAKLVDKDKLENTNNYKVADNAIVKAEVVDNNVIILLRDALKDGRKYTLRVRSIDRKIDKEYTFTAKDNTIPSVEEVVFAQSKGIRITASEPIKLLDNVRGRNFVIDGKNIAMNVEVYGREIVLTPYHKETFPATAKTITIAGLEDFAGFKSQAEDVAIEVIEDKEGPKVEDLILRGYNEVEVVFDKDIYIDSVEEYTDRNNVGNISYEVGRQNVYSDGATKIDTNRVRYTFNEEVYKELLRERTRFTIEGVQNHSGVKMERVTNMVAREVLDNIEPEIMKYEISARDVDAKTATIKIFFDKDVEGTLIDSRDAKKGFKVSDHFSLYERDVLARNAVNGNILSAAYDLDSNDQIIKDVVVVKLVNLTEWIGRNDTDNDNVRYSELNYILETENFTDVSSKRNKMYRDYYDFKLSRATGFQLALDGVTVERYTREDETHITLKFTQAVDRDIAENLTNYIFTRTSDKARHDVKDLKGRIVTERDGKEVTLILPGFNPAKYDSFRIVDTLKNTADSRLAYAYTYTFNPASINNGLYTISTARDVNGKITHYNIAPNSAELENINITTNEETTLVITANAKKLTVTAPNAHLTVAEGVTVETMAVKAIGKESVEILGTVENLIISTTDMVRVYGKIKDMVITSTVNGARVILTKEGKATDAVRVNQNETVTVINNDGTSIDKATTGAKAELAKAAKVIEDRITTGSAITTSSAIELTEEGIIKLTVKDVNDAKEIAALLEIAHKKTVAEGYKLTVSEYTVKTKSAMVRVTNEKDNTNTASDLLVFRNVIIEQK